MAPRKITTRRTSLPTERTKHSEKPKIIPRRSISTEEIEKVPQQENRFVIIKTMKNQNVGKFLSDCILILSLIFVSINRICVQNWYDSLV